MELRHRLLQSLFIGWFLILLLRLGYWQIVKAGELRELAVTQYGTSTSIYAPRGEIRFSDGYPMVINSESYLGFIEPGKLGLNAEQKDQLIGLLPASESAKKILDLASVTHLSWLPLAHQIPPKVKAQIEQMKISGLGFEFEPSRNYLSGSSSAYITGFIGKNQSGESEGYFGLEGYYNRTLTGKPGKVIEDRDALGRPIVISQHRIIQPQPGKNLVTSIDRTVQYYAFQKLKEGLDKYKAKAGSVAIMETKTGKILAMVSLPAYDPVSFSDFDRELFKNPIVSEGYEPGSTFKAIVMASALDAKVVAPDSVCTICGGPQTISGETIKNWNDQYHANSSMTDIILHSDNIGMVFVSRQLGKTKMLEYIRKFGFGNPTGIDIQEESTPTLRPDNQWEDIDWATAAFGQGIAVTRIQMLAGVNAIANGGILVPPRVVEKIQSGKDEKNLPVPDSQRIISRPAAIAMTNMMINGVEKGEVRYYRVPGYVVAGKTGTAQVPIAGHYDETKVIASFVGFAPALDPIFTMIVTLREPQTSPWGSTTAAPLWFSIAEKLFRYYQIPPKARAGL